MNTNQVNQAFEKWYQSKIDEANENNDMDMRHELHRNKERYKYGWRFATKASESEINSLKKWVWELEGELKVEKQFRMEGLKEPATGHNYWKRWYMSKLIVDIERINQNLNAVQNVADELTASNNKLREELTHHKNATIERIANALENADGELKYLPEYVALVRSMKAGT